MTRNLWKNLGGINMPDYFFISYDFFTKKCPFKSFMAFGN